MMTFFKSEKLFYLEKKKLKAESAAFNGIFFTQMKKKKT